MLYFFLSHAPGDDDRYVAKFYQDLSAEVERLVGADADTEVGAGALAVNEALATCRVFVALCSPRYFLNEQCGREWSLFADRVRRYERATGGKPDALIPIVWANADLPASVADSGPVAPTREGVSQLIRLRSWRRSYVDFVRSLAGRIVAAAAHDLPPPGPGVNLRSVTSAFDYTDRFERARVHFVVAAGTRDEMTALRQDVSYYGDSRSDWAPYRPALSEPLAAHARRVAAERLFGSDVVDIAALEARLDLANQHNEIVVLLVDAWITMVEEHRRTLVDLDGRAESSIAVLVPSSDDDTETVQRRSELTADVLDTFPHSAERQDPMFRAEIGSCQSFDTDLVAALEKAQNRIFRYGHVFRQPPSDPPVKRPLLKGP